MTTLPPSALALLEQKAYAHVVTTNAGGSPQVSMVWIDVEGGQPLFSTSADRLKTRNLRRDPAIVLSVQNPSEPQQYLVLHGTAEVTTDGAEELINRMAKKFMGVDEYPWRQPGDERVVVRVRVDRVGGTGPWSESA